jgi:hypothetical protein
MRPEDAPGLPLDPTPDERFRELAALLAAGVRALRDRPDASPGPSITSADDPLAESGPNCLELSPETRLSVHTG